MEKSIIRCLEVLTEGNTMIIQSKTTDGCHLSILALIVETL
jgi:hypothetical protein